MKGNEFRSGKLIVADFLPLSIFIVFPVLFLLFDAITLIVFLQFVFVFAAFILIILIDYLTAKIIIQQDYIEYYSILKKCRISWIEIKRVGFFDAVGLTVVSFDNRKTNFLSKKYIFVSTLDNPQFSTLKRNSNSFIRFNYNETLYKIITEKYKNVTEPKEITS